MASQVLSLLFFFIENLILIPRDNSSDPLSGDPDAVEWEKGFIEYAIENVSPPLSNLTKSDPDHNIFFQPPDEKPEGIEIFGLAERSYDDEIDFVVRHLDFPLLLLQCFFNN